MMEMGSKESWSSSELGGAGQLCDIPRYFVVLPTQGIRYAVCAEVYGFFVMFVDGMDDLKSLLLFKSMVTSALN